MPRQWVEVL